MKKKISVVVGVRGHLDTFKSFYLEFRKAFPDITLCIGALQSSEDTRGYLESLSDRNLKVAFGEPVDHHRVSLSENYNAALNLVDEGLVVLAHTDMVFNKHFFDFIDIREGEFGIYTTMEPPIFTGHVRPGKILGNCGTNFKTFSKMKFDLLSKDRIDDACLRTVPTMGYGFFLVGHIKDFQNVGGFDHCRFMPYFCEDDDICLRIRTKGYHMRVLDKSIAYHFVSVTSRDSETQELEGRANREFSRKWGFEPKFLWTIDYENAPEAFTVYNRTAYIEDNGRRVNLELLDSMFDSRRTKNSFEDSDIFFVVKEDLTREDMVAMVNQISTLRVLDNILIDSFSICHNKVDVIVRNKNSVVLADNTNYLALQREIKYE